jgi:hypothetical protein
VGLGISCALIVAKQAVINNVNKNFFIRC